MQPITVEAKGLTKNSGEAISVDHISFEVLRGECFGILGPEKSGKSSLMRMMYGLSKIEKGELFVLGLNMKTHTNEVKARIGIVPQSDTLENDFSVLDNLLVYASYFQIGFDEALERSKLLLRQTKLDDIWQAPVESLNEITRQKLSLVRSLMNQPDLLFLDELTYRMDSEDRLLLWDTLRKYKAEEKTIILATRSIDEAEQLCDRIALIDKGRILAMGTPTQLIRDHVGSQVVDLGLRDEDIPYYARKLQSEKYNFRVLNNKIRLFFQEPQSMDFIFKLVPTQEISVRLSNLNDVFLGLAGHELKD